MKSWRICRIGGCDICIHPLFVAALIGAALTGFGNIFLMVFAIVLVHELCHSAVAGILRYRLIRVELMPFGGVAALEGLGEGRPSDEAVIAMAGPLGNVLLITVAAALDYFMPLGEDFMQMFMGANFAMAVLNLLPALPLDGGRILRALLTRPLGLKKATRTGAVMGMALGLVLAGYGVWGIFSGIINLSIFMVAGFLLLSAVREYRRAPYLVSKVVRAARRHTRPVNHLAAYAHVRLGALVQAFLPGMYNVVTILGEDGRAVGEINEDMVFGAMQSGLADQQAGRLAR